MPDHRLPNHRDQRSAAGEPGQSPGGAPGSAATAIDELFAAAIKLHQAGRLAEAEDLYRRLLALQPDHADALNLLGVLANQTERYDLAVELIGRAIAHNGQNPGYFSNLGNALKQQHKLDEAIAAYRRAAAIAPNYFKAHYNLGLALLQQGKPDAAVDAYRRALAIEPGNAFAHCDLGVALQEQGKLDEAVAAFRRAIGLQPNYVKAHANLGMALDKQGKVDDAIAAWRQTVAIAPGFAEGHFQLGNALFVGNSIEEAGAAYREAIKLKPDYAEAFLNQGNVFRAQGKSAEAIAAYREAIRIFPNYAKAHSNLGIALLEQGKLTEAVAACRRAITLQPAMAEAHANLAVALWQQGKIDAAAAQCREAIRIQPDFPKAFSDLLFCLNYDEKMTPEALFAVHREWGERFEPRAIRPVHANARAPGRRLKIGYVSPDFRWHSVAYFFEPLLKGHDRQAVEVFCYADVSRPDGVTAYFQGHAEHWLSTIGLSDEALACRVRDDGIDILVDLTGHTAHNRLGVFARKPAPVQATWLGYPNTTGLRAIDYRLVDAITDPPGEACAVASETLVRLPGGFLCYGGLTGAPDPGQPPCLGTGIVTFGSFNNASKIAATALDAWSALLLRLPRSRLLLKAAAFADSATRAAFLAQFVERGVAPERVELVAWLPGAVAHVSLYGRVDIALDPFPYNGTTTTCEALWMGVPVVTLCGNRHAGRVGASLLTQVGLRDLIAGSVEDYVGIAADLAADPARLAELRRTLRPRLEASPLCDGPGFARQVEAAYRTMWRRWCEAPATAAATVSRHLLPNDFSS